MSALTANRDAKEHSGREFRRVVVSGQQIYKGALLGVNTSGQVRPQVASVALKTMGVALQNVLGDGSAVVDILSGPFEFHNSSAGDAIANKDAGALCYAADDQTVALTDDTGTRNVAGRILGLADNGNVIVMVGPNVA